MAKIPVHSSQYNAMMKFAKLNGLEVKHGLTKGPELMEIFESTWPGMTEFELLEDGETREPGQPTQEAVPTYAARRQAEAGDDETHYSFDPKVIVNIPSDAENGGSHPVPVCVNGDHILIHRNMDVPIPYRFYEALRIAVETNYRQEAPESGGKPITISELRHAFRFSTLEMPPRDEIEAYRKRNANVGIDKSEDPRLIVNQGGVGVSQNAADLLEALTALLGNRQQEAA